MLKPKNVISVQNITLETPDEAIENVLHYRRSKMTEILSPKE